MSGWFSGGKVKAWRARLHAATDTAALDEVVSCLSAAIKMGPDEPAWLAAWTAPPAPAVTAVKSEPIVATKVEEELPPAGSSAEAETADIDGGDPMGFEEDVEIEVEFEVEEEPEAPSSSTFCQEVERRRRSSIGTKAVAQRQKQRMMSPADSLGDDNPEEYPSIDDFLEEDPAIETEGAKPDDTPPDVTHSKTPAPVDAHPSSEPPVPSTALVMVPAPAPARIAGPAAVLTASWLVNTEQEDDERAEAAASSQAATMQAMAGSDLEATTAAISRQKEALPRRV